MINQERIWDAIYKWMGDHNIVVSIYEDRRIGYFKIYMTQDRIMGSVSAYTYIPDTEWYDIELDAFKFRTLMLDLYHRLQ